MFQFCERSWGAPRDLCDRLAGIISCNRNMFNSMVKFMPALVQTRFALLTDGNTDRSGLPD